MKKRIFGMLLMGAMVVASVSMFTSCKDYDDDIKKNSDDIAALTTQLSTLNSAVSTAQGTADAAKSAADAAAAAAKKAQEAADAAQGTADAAEAAAAAAAAAADAAQKAAEAAAAAQTVQDLQTTVQNVEKVLEEVKAGAVDQKDYDAKIKEIEAAIAALPNAEDLLTLDDVKKLLADEGFASAAVVNDLKSQIEALEKFKASIDALGLSADWKKGVDDAVASLKQIKNDVAANNKSVEELKKSVEAAVAKVDGFNASINKLTVFAQRNLRSINLSPDTFYGGIEGIKIFAYTPKEEKMNDKWHYFVQGSEVTLSKIGTADYHISPKSVDLADFQVGFFTRSSDIIEPATTEKTRGVSNTNRVKAVYTSTNDLIAKNYYNKTTGILTVPYRVENATQIANELATGKGTIAALQLTSTKGDVAQDPTVTSDYALVVPDVAKRLLICDNSFLSKNSGTTWNDIPGLGDTDVNTYHLHRNFSYLAIADTRPTHEIVYNKSFDISAVLLTHAINDVTVDVKDTTVLVPHVSTAKKNANNPAFDSDATLPKKVCTTLDDKDLEALGLHYEVNRVGYSLGSTNTEESNHIQIIKDEKTGHYIAYPRNVNGTNGATIENVTANASAVGRMPIVCIELKNEAGKTVTFAYMKFLIVQGETPAEENKEASFEVSDVWSDCGNVYGQVAWYQIENKVYNELLKISKETFDNRYVYDFYKDDTVTDENDETKTKEMRYGNRFKKSGSKFVADKDYIGEVVEEWNQSKQGKEDATTHIIKWYFTTADYKKVYDQLKKAGQLEYNWTAGQMTNKTEITTYVRYKRKSGDPEPAVYIKLTIPVGKFHFALGSLGGTKTLTYWYELNSATNAPDAKSAKEVRVNVPVPVPDSKMTTTLLSNVACPWGEALQIKNDNLLERTEFLKDLHDYFRNGQLSAAVIDKTHFKKLAQNKITPEFKFTTPSTSLGNATFNADSKGQWTVKGFSGKTYTLKLNAAANQILIVGSPDVILCSLNDDLKNIQSVIKFHEGEKQDDILNYMSHNDLGERETFTAYIMIDTPDACAPIEYDDMWFNVRFLRPCDLTDPAGGILPDAPNDWQYINLADYADVYDWRDYKVDPQNRIAGDDKTVAGYRVDFKYYQIDLNTDEQLFLTDAGLGTNERDASMTVGQMISINKDAAYKAKLWKTSEVNGLLVQKTDKKGGDQVPNSTKTTWIRYKNNSGVTGGFHIYLPLQMTYVFGNYPTTTQLKYVTLGITKSVNQDQKD